MRTKSKKPAINKTKKKPTKTTKKATTKKAIATKTPTKTKAKVKDVANEADSPLSFADCEDLGELYKKIKFIFK